MRRFILFTLVVLVLVSVITVNGVQAQEPLAQESIEVRVTIPVMQKMKIIDPVSINTDDLSGLEKGESIVINQAGRVQIASNANWNLQVGNTANTGYRVSLRTNNSAWKTVAGETSFTGNKGEHILTLDVKIEKTSTSTAFEINDSNPFQLSFTLGS